MYLICEACKVEFELQDNQISDGYAECPECGADNLFDDDDVVEEE